MTLEPALELLVDPTLQTSEGAKVMSNDRIEGAAHKAGGAVKEAAGKVTGNVGLQAKGAAEKVAGSVQNAAGKVEDKVKSEAKKA
jgi:uncharacterized protein YjbJ (UPF0337 family)